MKDAKYRFALIDRESGDEMRLPEGSFIALLNKTSGKIIPEDEPGFIIRGRDIIAPEAIKHYIARAKVYGCKDILFATVNEQLNDVEIWRNKNPVQVRNPD